MQTTAATRHALAILNDAAEDSAEEIRDMVRHDFQKLSRLLSDMKPEISGAFGEIRNAAGETMARTREKITSSAKKAAHTVDVSAHENAWSYIGSTAALALALGFILGRTSKA